MYALIFDMDGVLADTEALSAAATIKMFRELHGVEFEDADFTPFIGTGAVRYVAGPAEAKGVAIDLEAALAAREANFFAMLADGRDIAFPGARPLAAAAIGDRRWKAAIATSSPARKAAGTLRAARIDAGAFDVYLNGDDVVHKKPDPEIYLKAAERLEMPPGACVVVEDAITGVSAAKAAGMTCIAVTHSFPAGALHEADMVVDSLEELDLERLEVLITGVGR